MSNVTSAKDVTATFAQNTVTTPPATGGSVSCTPNPVPYGGNTVCTAGANDGYSFGSFTACGGTTNGNTCSLTNVTSAPTVSASFTRNTLSITSAPTSAIAGTAFNVTIGLSPGNAGAMVSITSSTCGATATGGQSTGTSATLSVTIPTVGACSITFGSGSYQTVTLANFMAYAGQISCAPPNNFLSSQPAGDMTLDPSNPSNPFIHSGIQNGWGLLRGPNWDDPSGGNCQLLNCTVVADPVNHLVNVSCDKAGPSITQNASFEYLILWNPVPFDQDPFADKLPQLSWDTPDDPPVYDPNCTPAPGGTGQCDFINALICHSDDNNASNAVVLPPIPNEPPFDAASNPQSQYLYAAGKQALACMAQQGSTPITGVGVQYWTKIIDRSDLGIKLP
jgi:hypothetical protein